MQLCINLTADHRQQVQIYQFLAPVESHEQYLPRNRPPVYAPGYFLESVVFGNNFINSRYVELIHRPGFAGCQVAEVNITDTHPN